jgi:ATP-dependent DNA helicase RecG
MPLQYLKGVGPRKAADLKKAGLNTVEDLLFRFPRRYEDRSRMQRIISLRPGMTAAVSGTVLNAGLAHTRRPGFRLFSALVQDDSGQIQAVWPNQAFLKDVIKSQQHIVLFGKVEVWGSRGLQITDPEFEIVKDQGSGIGDQGGSGRRAAPYRSYRPRLRACRQRDHQHAAPFRLAGAQPVAG